MNVFFQCSYGIIEIEDEIIISLSKFRQLSSDMPESGGQLFCKFEDNISRIVSISEPNKHSQRSRFSFFNKRTYEQREINEKFESGLHYIGDWHSHPQDYPAPSQADTKKILKIFNNSKHELNCMFLLIIGRLDVRETLWLGRVTKQEVKQVPRIT